MTSFPHNQNYAFTHHVLSHALSLAVPMVATVGCLTAHTPSYAHKPFPLDSHHVKTLNVSSEGLTRISVEGEAITDMFAYPGDLSNSVNLHESGHLFVAPSGLTEPIYLTVMTAEGHTQDLKLSFVQKKPEPILIVPPKEDVASESQIQKWLTVALLQEVPRGFHRESVSFDHDTNRRVTKDTVATECDRFQKGEYTIRVYSISPRSRMPLMLGASSSKAIKSHSQNRSEDTEIVSIPLSTDMYLSDDEAGLLSVSTLDISPLNCAHHQDRAQNTQRAFLAVISKTTKP